MRTVVGWQLFVPPLQKNNFIVAAVTAFSITTGQRRNFFDGDQITLVGVCDFWWSGNIVLKMICSQSHMLGLVGKHTRTNHKGKHGGKFSRKKFYLLLRKRCALCQNMRIRRITVPRPKNTEAIRQINRTQVRRPFTVISFKR